MDCKKNLKDYLNCKKNLKCLALFFTRDSQMNNEDYIQHKIQLQEILNTMEQTDLTLLFDSIVKRVPNIHYTKNKNGYFMDIKQIPPETLLDIIKQVEAHKR